MSVPYSDKKKIETVTTYLALGKLPMVSAVVDVPVSTIRQWKLQPWWMEMTNQIQTESDQELDSKLTKIVERSLDAVNDRIENGEFIFDPKSGTVKRTPVKLRDVSRVAVDLLDKRDILRGRPVKEKQAQQSIDLLQKLANQFAEWAGRKRGPIIDITEVQPIALHDQREEGLREGVQQVPLPEETNT